MHLIIAIIDWQKFYSAIEIYINYYLRSNINNVCNQVSDICKSTYNKGFVHANLTSQSEATFGTVRLMRHKPLFDGIGATLIIRADDEQLQWTLNVDQIYDLHLLKRIYPERFVGDQPMHDVSHLPKHRFTAPLPFADNFKEYVEITPEAWQAAFANHQAGTTPQVLPQPKRPIRSLTNLLKLLHWLGLTLCLQFPMQDWKPVSFVSSHELPAPRDIIAFGMYNSEEQRRLILNRHIFHIRLDGRGGTAASKIKPVEYLYLMPTTKLWNERGLDPDAQNPDRALPYGLYRITLLHDSIDADQMRTDYNYVASPHSTTTHYRVYQIEAITDSAPHLTIEVMHHRFPNPISLQFHKFSNYLTAKYGFSKKIKQPPFAFRL